MSVTTRSVGNSVTLKFATSSASVCLTSPKTNLSRNFLLSDLKIAGVVFLSVKSNTCGLETSRKVNDSKFYTVTILTKLCIFRAAAFANGVHSMEPAYRSPESEKLSLNIMT
jgi:hypothetical protein